MGITKWKELLDAAEKFFRSVHSKQKICLAHHGDADGITCGIYMYNIIKTITGKAPDNVVWVPTNAYDLDMEKDLILSFNPDVLIFVDMDISKEIETLTLWDSRIENIFIYDHHFVKEPIEIGNIHYFNIRLLDEGDAWHPASFFGYELAKRILPEEKWNEWISAAGLTGDVAINGYPHIQEIIRKKYPVLYNSVHGHAYTTYLEGIAYLLNAGFFFKPEDRETHSFNVIQKAFDNNDPMMFFNLDINDVNKLHFKHEAMEKDIIDFAEKAQTDAVIYDDVPLIAYKINTPHYIVGIVAWKIIQMYPDKVVYVANEYSEKTGCEIRVGDSIVEDVVKIMNEQRKCFDFLSAGGHPRAAGCLFYRDKYDEFMTSFADIMRKFRK